jgi:glycosyltransferase involved in cell wall biosynthesis
VLALDRSNSFPVVMHVAPGFQGVDARLFHQECHALTKAGYRLELVAHAAREADLESSLDFYSLGSLDYSSWRWRIVERLRRSRRAYLMAKQSKASIFHIHSPEFITWGIRLRRESRGKVIFDFREDYEAYARARPGTPSFLRRPLASFVRRQIEWAARNSDALICADEGTADLLKGHAQRTLVLHNFPRLDLFPYREQREEEKCFDIVHHGSMLKAQMELCLGIDDALIEQGIQVRWRFISKGGPDLDWLRAELQRRGILQRFTIDSMIPHERISDEVRKARIGISLFTSIAKFQNIIPRKIFEFMALGMPVVLADLAPTRPFVRNGENGFAVPADDCKAFAAAIARLLKDPALRHRMGATGRRLVEQEFNWETESEKLLRLYSELLSRNLERTP